ncbi:hypothetical protein ACMXYX_17910 (plasmid) [Neptuniibacter sp. QD72_48]|uniref:hypothetical protein n=1 Tax=Neptuniibacter sp. QD72_48 TaxID=3398214 RepID=UPI0039F5983C
MKKKILSAAIAVSFLMPMQAHAWGKFKGGPVIDINHIVTSVVQSGQEQLNSLIEMELEALDMIKEAEQHFAKLYADQNNTRAGILYKSQADTHRFNHEAITSMVGAHASMCVENKTQDHFTKSLCNQAVEEAVVDILVKRGRENTTREGISRMEKNYITKFSGTEGSGILLAENGSAITMTEEEKEAYSSPRVLVDTSQERSEVQYNAALDSTYLMSNLYKNEEGYLPLGQVREDLENPETLTLVDDHIRYAQWNLIEHGAFNHLALPVVEEGFEGQESLLSSIKTVATSEFGSELADENMEFYNRPENRKASIDQRRKVLSLAKRNWLNQMKIEQNERMIHMLALDLVATIND